MMRASLLLAIAAAPIGATVSLPTEVVSSTNYTISQVAARSQGSVVKVTGAICRRAGYFGLAPVRVRIEGLGQAGQIVVMKTAYLPSLSPRADQRCGHIGARIDDDQMLIRKVRVCSARSGPRPALKSAMAPRP